MTFESPNLLYRFTVYLSADRFSESRAVKGQSNQEPAIQLPLDLSFANQTFRKFNLMCKIFIELCYFSEKFFTSIINDWFFLFVFPSNPYKTVLNDIYVRITDVGVMCIFPYLTATSIVLIHHTKSLYRDEIENCACLFSGWTKHNAKENNSFRLPCLRGQRVVQHQRWSHLWKMRSLLRHDASPRGSSGCVPFYRNSEERCCTKKVGICNALLRF